MAELRQVVEQQTQGQFTIGDRALEIEPMRLPDYGAALPGSDLFTVRQALTRLAEDIGLRDRQLGEDERTIVHET
ncbi:hypothetical protein AB0M05_27955 [Streptomyces violaceusniger]|uniref:hypothetical protein n=1 Tax=Streptomyces violaceusniger TaxID=68280 RepID=UPI00343E9A70